VGVSLFRRKPQPSESTPAPANAPPPPADGKERLTANAWANKLQVNEVAAERAAMRAGRWHNLFTEEEFMALLAKHDV